MPFKSEKQRRFLWLKHPDIAQKWSGEMKAKALPRTKISDSVDWQKKTDLDNGHLLGWYCFSNSGLIGRVLAKTEKGYCASIGNERKSYYLPTLALAKRTVEQLYFHKRLPLAAEKLVKIKKNPNQTQSMLKTLKDARNHAIKAENLLASYCPELIPPLSKVIKKLEKFIEGK